MILGYPCDHDAASMILMLLEEELRPSGNRFKVKLTLSFQGDFSLDYQSIEVQHTSEPLRLCLAAHRTDSSRTLLYHKTTSRELYDTGYSLARQKGYDELLFLNENGEVTEGAISNLFIRKGRHFYTPPISSGLLNGIYRQYFLNTRPFAHVQALTLPDILSADTIYITNSVRGKERGEFYEPALIRLRSIILSVELQKIEGMKQIPNLESGKFMRRSPCWRYLKCRGNEEPIWG